MCRLCHDRDWPVDKLKEVKVADALKHPNWNMGKKITVDSATLFNKVCCILCSNLPQALHHEQGKLLPVLLHCAPFNFYLLDQGLEVIEAHYLYGAEYDNIEIVIHPQSIIHSMIETQVQFLFTESCGY